MVVVVGGLVPRGRLLPPLSRFEYWSPSPVTISVLGVVMAELAWGRLKVRAEVL